VVVDAARIEPVSNPKFPENREINREFAKIWPSFFASNHRADSMACSQIPCAQKQGIFESLTGNEQGISGAEQGMS